MPSFYDVNFSLTRDNNVKLKKKRFLVRKASFITMKSFETPSSNMGEASFSVNPACEEYHVDPANGSKDEGTSATASDNDVYEAENCNEDDNGSVVSDISGLSDTFHDFLVRRTITSVNSISRLQTDSSLKPSSIRKSSLTRKSSMESETSKQKDSKIFEFDFRVSFKDVYVRKYSRILGDNPACSSGPSLSIGWEYEPEQTYSVDEWEYNRDDLAYNDLADIMISARQRILILQRLGYTDEEIEDAMKVINTIKAQREQTAQSSIIQKTGEIFANAKVKLDFMFGKGRTKKGKKKSMTSKAA